MRDDIMLHYYLQMYDIDLNIKEEKLIIAFTLTLLNSVFTVTNKFCTKN